MRIGFGIKLGVLVLLPMMVLGGVSAFVARRSTADFVIRQMNERGMTLVTNLSRTVAYPVYVGLNDQVHEAARGLTARVGNQRLNPDLAFVVVVDNQGRVVSSEGKPLGAERLAWVIRRAMQSEQPQARHSQGYFMFFAPVRYRETQVAAMEDFGDPAGQTKTTVHELGAVALGLSLTGVENRQRELAQTIFQAVGLAALAALVLSVILTRSVLRPIGLLQQGVLALARGELGARVDVPGQDEISAAAGQFNKMAQAIEQQTEDLKHKNTQLAATQSELQRRMKDLSFLYDLEIESSAITTQAELSALLVRQLTRQFSPAGGFLAEVKRLPLGLGRELALSPLENLKSILDRIDLLTLGQELVLSPPENTSVEKLCQMIGAGAGARLLQPGQDGGALQRVAEAMQEPVLKERSVLVLPLVVHRQAHGALLLAAPPDAAFSPEDLRMLEMTATAYANHVERVGLIERELEVVKLKGEQDAARRYTAELEEKNRALHEMNRHVQEAYENLQKTQQQLVQSEKLATVGTLAGGIAHEINNPLGAILANTQMLQRKVQDENLLKGLAIIEKGAIRCKNIVEKVLRFARQRDRVHTPVNMKTVVEDTLMLLTHQMKYLQVKVDLQDVPPVWGDAGEIEQVLTNLLLNAHHAVTRMHEQDGRAPQIELDLFQEGSRVALRVRDNGVGMSDEVQQKAFDPFYTTKEVGQGTGLGLSVSYAILQAHRAEVQVESQEGVGTTFTLRFPTTPPLEQI